MRRSLPIFSVWLFACGAPGAGAQDAPASNDGAAIPACISSSQLAAWQAEIDQFDGGYRPTGSPAHEAYIARLSDEMSALGVDVHLEPFSFLAWTPASWSLELLDGTGAIELSGYLPYSGSTGPLGVTTGVVYVPASAVPLDANALAQALVDPVAWNQALTTRLTAALAALRLAGKIVVFEVPEVVVSLDTLTGPQVYVNDPLHTLPASGATIERSDLAAMLIVPAMLDAFAAAGAAGAVGVLPVPAEAARGEYAPFFGITTPNLPAVYVDRVHGRVLADAIAGNPLLLSHLTLDATIGLATSENLIGVLPGAADEEILIGSHTDGPNSLEDNGPAAILGLASCLATAERPRTVRFVLSGGHFVASQGMASYVTTHATELAHHALAAIEIEHLGAREWSETSPGVMSLTGQPEIQLVSTWPNPPLVAAGVAFASQFPRSIVGGPPILGEGQNFRVVPLVQFITMPRYLLLGHLPAITTQFTDYDLVERQVAGFLAMERALAIAPADELGVVAH
ncbi:MAG: hypothetical protein ABJE66_10655 [Deltaproteobacteria bacterium]